MKKVVQVVLCLVCSCIIASTGSCGKPPVRSRQDGVKSSAARKPSEKQQPGQFSGKRHSVPDTVIGVLALNGKTRKNPYKLAGRVKRVRYETADVTASSDKPAEGKRKLATVIEYNREGYILRQLLYGRRAAYKWDVLYGKDGEIQRWQHWTARNPSASNPSFKLSDNYIFRYTHSTNAMRRLIHRTAYTVVGIRDRRGWISSAHFFAPGGKPDGKVTFKRDAAGRVVEESVINPDGSLSHRDVMSYDSKGHLAEMSKWLGDGTLDIKSVYSNDAVSKLRTRAAYGVGGQFLGKRVTRVGEKDQDVAAEIYDADGSIRGRESSTYNAWDERGNWTKRTRSRSTKKADGSHRKQVDVEYRTITYY